MTDQDEPSQDVIDVFIEKAPSYTTIHCDGVIASPNGRGLVVVSFYNERIAIPTHVQIIKSSGEEFLEEDVDGKNGIYRQIQTSIFMDVVTVTELINQLENVRGFLKGAGAHDLESADE